MARVGQALTASRAWLDVSEFGSEDVGDIISESGSVMTDGVGLISSRVAALIVEALGDSIKRDGTIPTCFQVRTRVRSVRQCLNLFEQFRMGGYKGMLQVDPTLNEDKIVFRTSQKKFKSESHALAIVQAWRALPAFLNRPLIALLETLGVAPQAFLKLQKVCQLAVPVRVSLRTRPSCRTRSRAFDDFETARTPSRHREYSTCGTWHPPRGSLLPCASSASRRRSSVPRS